MGKMSRTVGIGIQDFAKLIEGNQGIKLSFEALLKGETIISPIDEQPIEPLMSKCFREEKELKWQ